MQSYLHLPLYFNSRRITAIFLVPLLVATSGLTIFTTDSGSFASFNPANLLSLGKLNPALFDDALLPSRSMLDVLVQTRTHNYEAAIADVETLGGRVTYQYQYVTGFAASLPRLGLLRLAQNPEVLSIDPDAILTATSLLPEFDAPADRELLAGSLIPIDEPFQVLQPNPLGPTALQPHTFISTQTHGALPLIADGTDGTESIAAIIDTGIYSGHFMIGREKIVGGVDVSPDVGTGFEGFDDIRNHWHGSAVAGVLGGFAQILIRANGLLAKSIELHTGESLPAGPDILGVGPTKVLTLSGIAPGTTFFVVKVFPHDGSGVSTRTVIRGMEAAIDAKVRRGIDIDIMSMSLGGPTLFDGRGIDGQAVDVAISTGIAVSIAGGNEGPAPMTVADPGASLQAITSAALVHPINTRVSWDLFFGRLGIGNSLFVSDTPQIHAFSSRGPTADGRAKPDVASIGVDALSAFPLVTNRGQGLAFVSGTSFATPATSGIISLLNDFVERRMGMKDGATPLDYKMAVMEGASPIPGYTVEEQGTGFVNAKNALTSLLSRPFGHRCLIPEGCLPSVQPGTPLASLADIRNLFLDASPGDAVRTFTTDVTLTPGQNLKFVFETIVGTESIKVTFTNVKVGANPNPTAQQAFPNSFEVYIHDAKRGGSGGGFGYYVDSLNVRGDAEFIVREGSTTFSGDVFGLVDPSQLVSSVIEPGFSKVVIEGDWTNAVPVQATVKIEVAFRTPTLPNIVKTGTVGQFDFATGAGLVVVGPFTLPRGTVLKLFWSPGDYAHFPSSDVDFLIAKGPSLASIVNFQGATLNSPERAVLVDSGRFFILTLGFEINPPGATENWQLQVFLPS